MLQIVREEQGEETVLEKRILDRLECHSNTSGLVSKKLTHDAHLFCVLDSYKNHLLMNRMGYVGFMYAERMMNKQSHTTHATKIM